MEVYKTVSNGVTVRDLTVERSRFIAALTHVESEKEAADFIASKRAEFHDAKHNCFAYILKDGTFRFSDDGEPHGTAGKPMLDVLGGAALFDACVVVTRYFGGVLLGTGGLVRAYSSAAKLAIEAAETVMMQPCAEYCVTCQYSDFDYMQKTVRGYGSVLDSVFAADVTLSVAVVSEKEQDFLLVLEKQFMGRYKTEKKGEKVLPLKNFS